MISSCEAVNGYLNFRLNRAAFVNSVVDKITEEGENYGKSTLGGGKVICIDYSSINIAKPFHIGHLSTTVIGAALYRIFNFLGYKAVGINHLGDYGTQFGKLIYAYKHWGSKEAVEKGGLKELTRLYVHYHELSEQNPEMDDEARSYFKKIESGDKECVELFEYFKSITLAETKKIYDLLDVKFDSYAGESFYNDKMQPSWTSLKRTVCSSKARVRWSLSSTITTCRLALFSARTAQACTPRAIWRRRSTAKKLMIFTSAYTSSRTSRICISSKFSRCWNLWASRGQRIWST